MKTYLLTEYNGDQIAVIKERENLHDTYKNIRAAIGNHKGIDPNNICLNVESFDFNEIQTAFEAEIRKNDGKIIYRDFLLEEIAEY